MFTSLNDEAIWANAWNSQLSDFVTREPRLFIVCDRATANGRACCCNLDSVLFYFNCFVAWLVPISASQCLSITSALPSSASRRHIVGKLCLADISKPSMSSASQDLPRIRPGSIKTDFLNLITLECYDYASIRIMLWFCCELTRLWK